jgi:pimeloyl-ACP methyl ester carboxylesterase
VILIGHSMGGMAIMALAERWSERLASRIARIAMISTSAGQMKQVNFGLPRAVAQARGPLLPLVRKVGPTAAPVLDWTRRASAIRCITDRYGLGKSAQPSAVVKGQMTLRPP